MSTDVLRVPYEIRRAYNPWFSRISTRRLERWYQVAKKSGLFKDPRVMMLLRATIQQREGQCTFTYFGVERRACM